MAKSTKHSYEAYLKASKLKFFVGPQEPSKALQIALLDPEDDPGTGPQLTSEGHTLYCPRGCCDTE